MHCPRCGQQQVSEDTRFCSRCGFPLALVAEILLHGGALPQLANVQSPDKKLLTRNNGLKFGLAWFLGITFLLVPIAAIAGLGRLAPMFAVVGIIGGLLMMIFSLLFLENGPKIFQSNAAYQPANFLGGNIPPQNALPPQQSQPVQDFMPPAAAHWKAPNTGELVRPHSVTEGTTKLLQKDE
jgi:hypothetical protein